MKISIAVMLLAGFVIKIVGPKIIMYFIKDKLIDEAILANHQVIADETTIKKISWTDAIMSNKGRGSQIRGSLFAGIVMLDIIDALANVYSGEFYILFGTAARFEITNRIFSLLQVSDFFNWKTNTLILLIAVCTSIVFVFFSLKSEEKKYFVLGLGVFFADVVWLSIKDQRVSVVLHLVIFFVTFLNLIGFASQVRNGETEDDRQSADIKTIDNDSFKEF